MTQMNQNQIPVIFVNLYTQLHLSHAILPALPVAGDDVFLHGLAYEVANCEWTLLADGAVDIVVFVRPQLDANGKRPFSYAEESELTSGRAANKQVTYPMEIGCIFPAKEYISEDARMITHGIYYMTRCDPV
ncbi:MAG: hypothetical protein GY805_25180 [Chloroflexi bacterium]|nr:hypothetical protein [Chloroflexota bacterium]